MKPKQSKPYRLELKGRELISLTEIQGEELRRWWKESRHTHKIDLVDDQGNYAETILSSQIMGIQRRTTDQIKRDDQGRTGEEGFICDWGTWHPIEEAKKEYCECRKKFKMNHAKFFQLLREKWKTIHTCTDITKEMQDYILYL